MLSWNKQQLPGGTATVELARALLEAIVSDGIYAAVLDERD